jgi:hypothetical protein
MEWATFHGAADSERDGRFRLTATSRNGIISVPRDSVTFDHNRIMIRIGTIVEIIEEPDYVEGIASFTPNSGCSRACSIGAVEVCCDDGRVLGPCRVMG